MAHPPVARVFPSRAVNFTSGRLHPYLRLVVEGALASKAIPEKSIQDQLRVVGSILTPPNNRRNAALKWVESCADAEGPASAALDELLDGAINHGGELGERKVERMFRCRPILRRSSFVSTASRRASLASLQWFCARTAPVVAVTSSSPRMSLRWERPFADP